MVDLNSRASHWGIELLNRSMFGYSRTAKGAACKAIICPMLEYAEVVRNPHNLGDVS